MSRLMRASTGEVTEVTMTDDPADPCGYCVHWDQPPEDFYGELAVPMVAPGVPATRLYRRVHKECDEAVTRYIEESAGL